MKNKFIVLFMIIFGTLSIVPSRRRDFGPRYSAAGGRPLLSGRSLGTAGGFSSVGGAVGRRRSWTER